ncbi:neocarzinostatin apoprotein domain-containing protein [Amycolatopsis sp. lyj-90]|uniref:neocarzinostatin apoprotein domain-containing protein n=1 Tax=Amycolatopsis sp. lyj-90 TaxID=2789285 RepID=UPI00397A69B6
MKSSSPAVKGALVALIAVLGLGSTFFAAVAGESDWTLTVSPSTNLAAEQIVSVGISGFTPNRQTMLLECTIEGDCYTIGYPISDANGGISTTATVFRYLSWDELNYDCKAPGGGCEVIAADLDTGELKKVPLTFL